MQPQQAQQAQPPLAPAQPLQPPPQAQQAAVQPQQAQRALVPEVVHILREVRAEACACVRAAVVRVSGTASPTHPGLQFASDDQDGGLYARAPELWRRLGDRGGFKDWRAAYDWIKRLVKDRPADWPELCAAVAELERVGRHCATTAAAGERRQWHALVQQPQCSAARHAPPAAPPIALPRPAAGGECKRQRTNS